MNYRNYNRYADLIRHNSFVMEVILVCNILFTVVGFIMYPLLLIRLWCQGKKKSLFLHVIIPGIAFILLSLYRRFCNAPRPYEVHPIRPLIKKNKTGRSFPSRHIFSIMLIGVLWLGYSSISGYIILLCGTGLAVLRVIGGVHFIKDVFWGAVLGICSGITTVVITSLL